MEKLTIKNEPNTQEIWAGIGGHFDNLGQIINEFLDNSISNFIAHKSELTSRNILVSLKELEGKKVEVKIEDSGTGMQNIDDAFTLGCQKSAETPLNEHGFGLKHALASADPENNNWEIYTRIEQDIKDNCFKKISAPYKLQEFSGEIISGENWPGQYNRTGTIIKFLCSYEMYKTLGKGIQGGVKAFVTLADILCEDIGFVYAGIIKDGIASITLKAEDINGEQITNTPIGEVAPNWSKTIEPGIGTENVDLGDGTIRVDYTFGSVNDNAEREEFDNNTTRKYYLKNMSSSGVEIRINGRVLCYNLFKEIWGIEKHNSYNHLLIIINLKSKDKEALPKTRTSKNGLREGDERLEKLYEWIREMMPEPVKDISLTNHEKDLFEELCDKKKKFDPDPNKVINTEMKVFKKTGNKKDLVRLDLYEKTNGKINIYEGKIDFTTSKDVYQLRMYWDGLVYDGINPNVGSLVAREHPDSVKSLIQIVNTMKDANGNHYNLVCKTWKDCGLEI